jgi:hypothetical protein
MIIYKYYFAILLLALIFFYLSVKNTSILLTIIIIIIIGYYYFNKIAIYDNSLVNNFNNKIKLINGDIKDREVINNDNYYLKKFPVAIKYLKYDEYLIELLLNIRFLRVFDDGKYTNIILLIEKLMKLYIFMLGNRYDINTYFNTFTSVRTNIIKELYSIYIIVPDKFIYIYKINPFDEIKKTIHDFITHSRKMLITVENYAYNNKGIYYLEDTKYKPYEKNSLEVY